MITFSCEFCARKYRVDDGLAGRKVKCKECAPEMTTPSGSAKAVAATAASKPDLYGLDEDEAPLPPPRRPGLPTETGSPARGGKRASSGDPSPMTRFGYTLMGAGGLAFVLPLIGLQIKGLHLLPPQAQMSGGMMLLVVGLFCVILSKVGVLKGLGVTITVIVFLPVLAVVVTSIFGNRGNRVPPKIPAGRAPQWPRIEDRPAPVHPALGRPDLGRPDPGRPVFSPPGQGTERVTIFGGRAREDRGGVGVAAEIDYRLDNGNPGFYDLFVKSSRGETQIAPPVHLMPSGSIRVSVPGVGRDDGPFEAHFKSRSTGELTQVSNTMDLAWQDTAAPGMNPGNPPEAFQHGPGAQRFGPPNMPLRIKPGRRVIPR